MVANTNDVHSEPELTQHFEDHRAWLRRRIQLRLGVALQPRLDADDILSEAFTQAQRNWEKFQHSIMTPRGWLYRIAHDCLIEAWRHANRQCRTPDVEMPWPDGSSLQMAFGLMDSTSSPSAHLVREELRQHVQDALARLRREYREILWMRYFDDLSYKEAAFVLSVEEDRARLWHLRALKQLREVWQQLHPPEDSSYV